MTKDFIILINSTKNQKINISISKYKTTPKFSDKTNEIYNILKLLSKEEISRIFKINSKLTTDFINNINDFQKVKVYAIELFDGLFYKQFDVKNFDHTFLEKHVRILDAFYGILKPFDLISPYRLDFKIKLPNLNLIDFWSKTIQKELFNYELYSLCSKEYEQLLGNLKFTNLYPFKSFKIKINRGQKFKTIILNKDLNNVSKFN